MLPFCNADLYNLNTQHTSNAHTGGIILLVMPFIIHVVRRLRTLRSFIQQIHHSGTIYISYMCNRVVVIFV